MIQADARSRLTADDVEFVLRATRRARQDEGLDERLDRPELASLLAEAPVPGPSPTLNFYVLARQALRAHGVDDRRVADYCAALLREFGLRDRSERIAPIDDHRHRYLVDIVADAAACRGDRQFRVLVHLGNYALWIGGVFPAWISARRDRRGGPDLSYYDAMGTRGFSEASDHRLASQVGLDDVFRLTADRFSDVRSALNDLSGRLRAA
jgi:hypothetical protein